MNVNFRWFIAAVHQELLPWMAGYSSKATMSPHLSSLRACWVNDLKSGHVILTVPNTTVTHIISKSNLEVRLLSLNSKWLPGAFHYQREINQIESTTHLINMKAIIGHLHAFCFSHFSDLMTLMRKARSWGCNVQHGDNIVSNSVLYIWKLLREWILKVLNTRKKIVTVWWWMLIRFIVVIIL